jgi:hypothetical protein
MSMADHKPVWRDERYRDHVETYTGFMKFAQYSTATVIIVLVLMALFLL